MTNLITQLKKHMVLNHLKPVDVASIVGVSERTVTRWIKGECRPQGAAEKALKEMLKGERSENTIN